MTDLIFFFARCFAVTDLVFCFSPDDRRAPSRGWIGFWAASQVSTPRGDQDSQKPNTKLDPTKKLDPAKQPKLDPTKQPGFCSVPYYRLRCRPRADDPFVIRAIPLVDLIDTLRLEEAPARTPIPTPVVRCATIRP